MSIRRVKEITPIEAGQYVCLDTAFEGFIVGATRKVVKVSGIRIYFVSKQGEDIGEYCTKKRILFVCDNEDEVAMIRALSNARAKNLAMARDQVISDFDQRLDDLIKKASHE